jgi:cation diffusion facilitator CzcD-associated flavoprotein CzcO
MLSNNEKHIAMPSNAEESQLHDIIVIGAGISGINAAYRIQTEAPSHLNYVILEGRESLGGTWDLFKYPGVRSDSDIFTFGFPWSPWGNGESLPAGGKIKNYIERSAGSAGIDKHILYRHSVASADWCSDTKRWKLKVNVPEHPQPLNFEARFVVLGTGYYDYKTPLQATIPGIQNFGGKVIHPQFWPENYNYTGKNVVVIGSGATAVTILPSMADSASRVTMLQRSPGYIMPLPSTSLLTSLLFTLLPALTAHFISRVLWLFKSYITTFVCQRCPGLAKNLIRRRTIRELPPDISWDPHFKPRYNPWEQRFCACMDGDFFAALRSGKADVVTDKIRTVTEKTIELQSGATLHPDIIVTATGLKLKFGGGIDFRMDGQAFDVADKFAWKSVMLQDVPNLFFMTGYENASWTLGADVGARLFVRILRRIEGAKAKVVVPRLASPEDMPATPMMRLTSTYLENAGSVLPKGGTGHWGPKSNYFVDMAGARWGSIPKDLEMI